MADEKEKTVSAPVHVVAPTPKSAEKPVKREHADEHHEREHEHLSVEARIAHLEARQRKIERVLHEVQKLAHSLGGHSAPPSPEDW